MAYSTPTTRATGYVVLATNWNEFVNNFIAMAPDIFTTDGDIHIASGANVGVRLGAFTSSTGTLKRANGGLEVALADPNADRILFWDDGAGVYAYLAVDSTLTISGTTLSITTAAPAQATQTEAEAESNVNKYLPPDLLKYGPWACKFWCRITGAGALESPSYNVASITDDGAGDRTIVFDVAFSTSVYPCTAEINEAASNSDVHTRYDAAAVGSVDFEVYVDSTGNLYDLGSGNHGFGDQ